MLQIKKTRLPTSTEYDLLAGIAKEDNAIMHWKSIYSWCQDVRPGWPLSRVVRGFRSARYRSGCIAANRYMDIGFRPVIEVLTPDALCPDGATIIAGTLYMDGYPVRVPKNPTFGGDIPDYIPGTKLELRGALDDTDYQVRAIKAGNILIADRVLLRKISWEDLDKLGFCGNAHKISKGNAKMKKDQSIIYLGGMAHGSFTIACSQENEKKILSFLSKRYPEWVRDCEGKDIVLQNKVLDAFNIMRDLLEDENLELLGRNDKAIIRLEDEVYGTCVVACSRGTKKRVEAFLTKRYPKWAGKCIGKTGMTPWNDVLDAVRDMRELLDDDKLEFLGGCSDILVPAGPTKG